VRGAPPATADQTGNHPFMNIAIEHGPFIVDLPIKNGDFP
jgi:hypothetical protein